VTQQQSLNVTMKSLFSLLCVALFSFTSNSFLTHHIRSPLKPLFLSDEPNEAVQERIQGLVDANPVLLFMKGSKIFPQCGFSNTAVQILQSYGVAFETVGTCER